MNLAVGGPGCNEAENGLVCALGDRGSLEKSKSSVRPTVGVPSSWAEGVVGRGGISISVSIVIVESTTIVLWVGEELRLSGDVAS